MIDINEFKTLQNRLKNKLYNLSQDFLESTDYISLLENWEKLNQICLKRQFLRTTRQLDSLSSSLLIAIEYIEKKTEEQEAITALHEIRRKLLKTKER